MPVFKPFKAIHATEKNIKFFPSKSVDQISSEQIKSKLESIQDSIIQLIAPTFNAELPPSEKYNEVRTNFESALDKEKLIQDSDVAFYIYQQKSAYFNYVGILGLFDLKDLENNTIRVHENTLEERVHMFSEYLSGVQLQSEPVLITYPYSSKIEVLMDREMKGKMLLSHTDEDGIQHNVWRVDNRLNLTNYIDAFKNMEAVYIADGHHRLASTKENAERMKKQDKHSLGNEPYNYVLAYAIDNNALKIYEYNRLVKDLNNLTKEEFLAELSKHFKITEKGNIPYFPSQQFHISMYLDGEFYGLYINHELRGNPEGLGNLDTFLFEKYIAKDILQIEDSTKDKRIDFLKGTNNKEGIEQMKEKVDSGEYKVGFGFFPVKYSDLKLIADLQLKMPPKSTYINPKLLTGLVMYNMKK